MYLVLPCLCSTSYVCVCSGVYDSALGPTDYKSLCPTCGLKFGECPGHMGHINLSVPVYNPTLFTILFKLLRLKCFACHHLRTPASRSRMLAVQLMLLDVGRVEEAMELESKIRQAVATAEAAPAHHTSSESKGSDSKSSGKKGGARKGGDASLGRDDVEAKLAVQDSILTAYEVDCIAVGGPDVGCGFSDTRVGEVGVHHKYSQHVRKFRDEIVATYLSSFPAKTCANCKAASIPIKKDGYSKLFSMPLPKKVLQTVSRQ